MHQTKTLLETTHKAQPYFLVPRTATYTERVNIGVPACYGGFESLVENLLDYTDQFDVIVFCSSKKYNEKKGKKRHPDTPKISNISEFNDLIIETMS